MKIYNLHNGGGWETREYIGYWTDGDLVVPALELDENTFEKGAQSLNPVVRVNDVFLLSTYSLGVVFPQDLKRGQKGSWSFIPATEEEVVSKLPTPEKIEKSIFCGDYIAEEVKEAAERLKAS